MIMSWLRTARKAAAKETGRRMWRWFFAVEVLSTVLPALLIVAGLVVAAGAVATTTRWWMPYLPYIALAGAALVGLVVMVWAWRRWGWRSSGRAAAVLTGVTVAVLLGVPAVAWVH
jgi:hypothetical protein